MREQSSELWLSSAPPLIVFHFFFFAHSFSLSLSQCGFYLRWGAMQSVFLRLALLGATVCGPLALQGRLVKLWKWKETHSKCWQLWYMENIKRAESSLVVRGANMIISLYLRSISAASSLGLLVCAVDMMVILRLPFWLIGYEML